MTRLKRVTFILTCLVLFFMTILLTSYLRNSNFKEGPVPDKGIEWDIKERKRLIKEFCDKHDNVKQWERVTEYAIKFYVDDNNRFIYCHMPKIATTTWLKVLLPLNNHTMRTDVHKVSHYKSFRIYDKKELPHRLQNYFKFLFVRHPLERFISAYKDKILRAGNALKYLQRNAPNLLQKRFQARKKIEKKPAVTFSEFVSHYLPGLKIKKSTAMFGTVTNVCQPCLINYDFIGHYETLQRDADYVLKKLSLDKYTKFPRWKPSNTSNEIMYYFQQLSTQQQQLLQEILKYDYEMFGYKL